MVDYETLPPREIERLSRAIFPGEWAVEGRRPISTLLGSCIAVCLYDSVLPLGGMNHFMLPQLNRGRYVDEDVLLAGDACMEALLNAMLNQGAVRRRITAKAFGGGAVINTNQCPSRSVGQRNVDFIREWLAREGIPLIASDFLGPWSRKVLLLPSNGEVLCKRMATSMVNAETIAREEQAYAESLLKKPASEGGKRIELF